jgi:uncharacterized protein
MVGNILPRMMNNREFNEVLTEAIGYSKEAAAMQRPGPTGLPVRPLGRTGEWLTIVGLGGWDIVFNNTDDEAIRLMREAFDLGINFWDNAWEYHDGRSEEVMGRAMREGGLRDRIFLMTKVCARDAEGFGRQLDDCLRRLRVDYIDLVQFHSIQYPGDSGRLFDPENGGFRVASEALRAGKFRYLGFTGHMDPEDHLTMMAEPCDWAAVQMPINLVDAHKPGFQQRMLAECRRRDIGVLGMKSLGGNGGPIPKLLGIDGEICRRYAMSMPVTSLVCGVRTAEEVRQTARIARDFIPLGEEELAAALSLTRGVDDQGQLEGFKVREGEFGCAYFSKIYPGLSRQPDR